MTEEELKKIGFKRKWFSDKSGYWMQIKIKSFLKNCHLTTDLDRPYLLLWTTDIDNGQSCVICKVPKDKATIESLVYRLKK